MKTMTRNLCLAALLLAPLGTVLAAEPSDRMVKPVHFQHATSHAALTGRIQGYRYVDYQLRAAAGQTLKAQLQTSHPAVSFNLLPPGSVDVAMQTGQTTGNHVIQVLPDDGLYTLRVYMERAAARRNESASFTLSVEVNGKALAPLKSGHDALVPGTRYHARSTVPCQPAYVQTRECQAGVIRRGHDGNATVELSWGEKNPRRILFVHGKPAASDASQPMTFSRNERSDFVIQFGNQEHFVIPEALVFGG